MSDAFNSQAFFKALNAERLSRQLTWKEVGQASGVQASTLTRMGSGKNPDVNGLASLLAWSGLKAENFITNQVAADPESFTQAVALLRAAPGLKGKQLEILIDVTMATYKTLRDLEE